ncbi:DExH-box ATP-dependent RNA helicase DExH3 [Camellia lanceoleosa]|uniref:DExH-box ATP-dependent RNA helicase DExH3 n=1 Tax=Camellia lanceoleosa TaxID=1840588 RepID=A0ACC0IT44_9ERIC|nr:DExH-box ATP-dependent RNA helicase DExH3 [Camellia lanceoleosa]
MAETSITINDVVFVVDLERPKRHHMMLNNTPCPLPSWISKASAGKEESLCLQIKSLQLGSISDFLSRALQPPEPVSVQNAIEYLMIIGTLDENENLTVLGRNLSMLPVEPKLGKMLLLGAIFNCLDPLMIVVAGLSVRDPFLMPFDKKDLAESAKAQFSARDYSDHLALVRAYDGWKDAERHQSGYEYCWRNFLSAQTLKAIDSLRKQFFFFAQGHWSG